MLWKEQKMKLCRRSFSLHKKRRKITKQSEVVHETKFYFELVIAENSSLIANVVINLAQQIDCTVCLGKYNNYGIFKLESSYSILRNAI